MLTHKEKYNLMLSFCVLTIFLFTLGALSGTSNAAQSFSANLLNYTDMFYIFFLNEIVMIMWFVETLFGYALISIFKFIYSMGFSIFSSGIPLKYFLATITHGACEIISLYFLYVFCIKNLQLIIKSIKNKNISFLNTFYLKSIPYIFKSVTILLIIGAVLEVVVSNRLLVYLGG